MKQQFFPVIDPVATGQNILRLRKERGLSVRDVQHFFGFEEPQAVYKWQWGRSLPTVDNLYALSALLGVSMDEILVPMELDIHKRTEQQEGSCCSVLLIGPAVLNTAEVQLPFHHFCLCRPAGRGPRRHPAVGLARAKKLRDPQSQV